MPYSVIGSCKVREYSTSLLFCRGAILDSLSQESPLVLELRSHRRYLSSGVAILQSSDTSLSTSLVKSRSLVLYVPFLTSCEAIELAEMGQGQLDCLVLPVKLIIAFHASWLECVKSMALTASNQRFLCLLSSLASKAEAAVLKPSPCGAQRNVW